LSDSSIIEVLHAKIDRGFRIDLMFARRLLVH
jgi:hypothetical protein